MTSLMSVILEEKAKKKKKKKAKGTSRRGRARKEKTNRPISNALKLFIGDASEVRRTFHAKIMQKYIIKLKNKAYFGHNLTVSGKSG